jgi:hypothetical protein
MAKPNRTIPLLNAEEQQSIWEKVICTGSNDCWLWTGSTDDDGYGVHYVRLKTWRAARLVYFIHYGVDPSALLVCHTCDNPPCCNPAHLFLGTEKDNTNDCRAKGRLNTPSGVRHRTYKHPELVLRGEQIGNSKLSAEQVENIRNRFAAGESQQSIANELGVTRGAIKGITSGKGWKHVAGPIGVSDHKRQGRAGESSAQSKLTAANVQEIRRRHTAGERRASLARYFGVTGPTISHIIKRRSWCHVA